MTKPLTKYGHFQIEMDGETYDLKPTFAAMASLGDWSMIEYHWAKVFGRRDSWCYISAIEVLQACCAKPLPARIIPRMVPNSRAGNGYSLAVNSVTFEEMALLINITKGMLLHGVTGVVEHGEESETAATIDFYEYIESAMVSLSMTQEQAANLTMTEFIRLTWTKYPQLKPAMAKVTKDELDFYAKIVDLDKERAKRK